MTDATKKPLTGAAKASAERKAAILAAQSGEELPTPNNPPESDHMYDDDKPATPATGKRSILSGSITEGGLF